MPSRIARLRPDAAPELAVFAILIVCNLLHLPASIVPYHDQMVRFQVFYFFYNDLFFNAELPRWVAEYCYGAPAEPFEVGGIGPCDYLALVLGCMLRMPDVMRLFKLSMFFHEFVFAAGIMLFGRQCYRSGWTRFMLGAGAILTLNWWGQPWFNLYDVYLLPIVFTCLIWFFRDGAPKWLYLAAIVLACSMIGNVTYLAPLYVLVLAAFCLPQYRAAKERLRSLRAIGPWLHPYGLVLLLVAAGLVPFVLGCFQGFTILAGGRDVRTGAVSLEDFLNFAKGRPALAQVLLGYTTGAITQGDNTYYVGLLPLVLFVYALFTVRQPLFYGLAASAIFVAWFAAGGMLATATYFLPGISLMRHIGLLHGFDRLFVLLAAGYGIDRLQCVIMKVPVTPAPPFARRARMLLALAALISLDLWWAWRPNDADFTGGLRGWEAVFLMRLAAYAIPAVLVLWLLNDRAVRPPRYFSLLLVVPFLFDVTLFQAAMLRTFPSVPANLLVPGVFAARRPEFAETRLQAPPKGRPLEAFKILNRPMRLLDRRYQACYLLLGYDPCVPEYRADYIATSVYEMIIARGGQPSQFPKERYLPPRDDSFYRSLGCAAPKLRVVSQIVPAEAEDAAMFLFARLSDPFGTVVIRGSDSEKSSGPAAAEEQLQPKITVEIYSPNRLQLALDNRAAGPRWLVYADAYHPGWKATINGKPTPVLRANIGQKAVKLQPGRNAISLTFENGTRKYFSWAFALIGLTFAALTCGGLALSLLRVGNTPLAAPPSAAV